MSKSYTLLDIHPRTLNAICTSRFIDNTIQKQNDLEKRGFELGIGKENQPNQQNQTQYAFLVFS